MLHTGRSATEYSRTAENAQMIARLAAIFLCAYVASSCASAANSEPASGEFISQSARLGVHGAVAFRGRSLLYGEAIVVAVSNAPLKPEAIADYFDRRRAIDRHVKDGQTGVVYFEFSSDGRYRGFGYDFGGGNGCEFCTGRVSATVKLAEGRIAGRLKDEEPNRRFDITLDVPLLPDGHGAPLPEDGGAAGGAYLAYHAALVARDPAALQAVLSRGQLEVLENARKSDRVDGFMAFLASDHPDRPRIDKGFANERVAVLLVSGTSAGSKVAGEVLLLKEGDAWKVDDELMEPAAE
jgi:hypothetical protein